MSVAVCLLLATSAFAALWLSRTVPTQRAATPSGGPPLRTSVSRAPAPLGPGRRHGGRPGAEQVRAAYGLAPAPTRTVVVEHVATRRRVAVAERVPLALPAGSGR